MTSHTDQDPVEMTPPSVQRLLDAMDNLKSSATTSTALLHTRITETGKECLELIEKKSSEHKGEFIKLNTRIKDIKDTHDESLKLIENASARTGRQIAKLQTKQNSLHISLGGIGIKVNKLSEQNTEDSASRKVEMQQLLRKQTRQERALTRLDCLLPRVRTPEHLGEAIITAGLAATAIARSICVNDTLAHVKTVLSLGHLGLFVNKIWRTRLQEGESDKGKDDIKSE